MARGMVTKETLEKWAAILDTRASELRHAGESGRAEEFAEAADLARGLADAASARGRRHFREINDARTAARATKSIDNQ